MSIGFIFYGCSSDGGMQPRHCGKRKAVRCHDESRSSEIAARYDAELVPVDHFGDLVIHHANHSRIRMTERQWRAVEGLLSIRCYGRL